MPKNDMTAEEKLREWYEKVPDTYTLSSGEVVTFPKGRLIAPEHIDLIANLVVERLKNA